MPWGGSLFPAYHLNHSYVDCDVYVSLAKLKNHATAGVTMGIKNNFGITPPALYSHHEPNEQATSARMAVFHSGEERPADGLPQEIDPKSPRRPTYRVPRHTVDSIGIRPIDLTIIDGIETVSGGEGPWLRAGLAEARLAPGGPQPGLHRRRRHGGHGIRPDGRAGDRCRSPATIIWPWPPSWDSGRTTRKRSRSWGCRSRRRCTPSAGNRACETGDPQAR